MLKLGSGNDDNSCEEEGEGGHHGVGFAPRVPCVAVVCATPGEGKVME